jgi:hypothetical protein
VPIERAPPPETRERRAHRESRTLLLTGLGTLRSVAESPQGRLSLAWSCVLRGILYLREIWRNI